MAARDGAGAAAFRGRKRHHAPGGDRAGAERTSTAGAANRQVSKSPSACGARVCVRGAVSAETLRQAALCLTRHSPRSGWVVGQDHSFGHLGNGKLVTACMTGGQLNLFDCAEALEFALCFRRSLISHFGA